MGKEPAGSLTGMDDAALLLPPSAVGGGSAVRTVPISSLAPSPLGPDEPVSCAEYDPDWANRSEDLNCRSVLRYRDSDQAALALSAGDDGTPGRPGGRWRDGSGGAARRHGSSRPNVMRRYGAERR